MASGTDDSELEHYKIGVANGGIALWTWYPESNKVWLSPHWKELVGYTLSEINVLGPTPESRSSLIHPEDREKVFAGMANHAETGEPFDMTFQVLHKNGTYRRIRSRAEAIRDKQGTQIGLGGAARDITDWYNSLQQLQDNEVMLHKLVQSNPVAMVIVSEADGSVTMMNDTFTELFGYSIEDIPTTESWWPQAYPDPTYREWVIKEWNKRLQEAHAGSPRLQPINCTVTCKDGSTRRIHFEAISLEGDYMVVFIDKTALWESEQLLSQITDNINDVFFLLSLDRSVVHYVSPGFEKLYGIPSQTIYDRPDSYMELVHHLDREELIKCFNGPPEEPYEVEVRIKRPNDGEIRWVQIRGVPVKNEKGEVYRIAGIAKDVSEERALEQEVMLASSASTRANINLHDLICTPLAGSAMSLRALKSQLPEELAKQLDEQIQAIKDVAKVARMMIGGGDPLKSGTEDLEAGIQTIFEQHRTIYSGIHFSLDPQCSTSSLKPETATQILVVICEAVCNACKHAQASEVRVTLSQPVQDSLRVAVADNGKGRVEDLKEGERFGLRSMRQRVRVLGGRLWIANHGDAGVIIIFEIPLLN